MFHPPIYEVIDEWATWKYEQTPLKAGAYRSLMIRFVKEFKLRSVEEIEEKHMAFYMGEQLTGFYMVEAEKALKSFLTYCRMAGYECPSPEMAKQENLLKLYGDVIIRPKQSWIPGKHLKWLHK
jgi:hypothetical protein